MTTPTPTSNPPAGLPDVATLARMASELFAGLPGDAGLARNREPAFAGAPGQLPAQPPDVGAIVPHAIPPAPPVALPNTAPSTLPSITPASYTPALTSYHSVPGPRDEGAPSVAPVAAAPAANHGLGVPAGPAVAQPSSVAAPYYFLEQAGAYPNAGFAREPTGIEHPAVPFFADLAGGNWRVPAEPKAAQNPPANGNGAYYFTDTASLPRTAAPQVGQGTRVPFDVNAIRRDFPILSERVNGRPLVWFDNAATTQKPQAVIDRLAHFYTHENSNIHRAAHELAARATDAYEAARNKVARFLGAASADEIIFVRGATEAINLVAQSWGRKNIEAGDEIIVSNLEHHANIVPWQQLAAEKGAKIRVIPVDDTGQVLLGEYQRLLNSRTKLVAVTQVSNALGTVVPVREIVQLARRAGATTLVDGAQSVSHMRINVQALDADFFVFSGHKIFGPTGIGVVYGKRAVLEETPPWQGGGNMIADVTFERTVYQGPPSRFEAGTGNIADAAGLGAALDYVDRVGIENIARYEHDLLEYATGGLKGIRGLRLIGTAADKASVASFVLEGYKPEEVGKALNEEGVAVRAGHHCAQPILRRFGVEATVRPSFAFYNTFEEIDCLIAVLRRLTAHRRLA